MDDLSRREAAQWLAAGGVAAGVLGVAGAAGAQDEPKGAAAQPKVGGPDRGSEKLMEELFGRPPGLDRGELRRLVSTALDKPGVKLVDWWWYGMPAIDGVFGTFEVPIKSLGDAIRDMAGSRVRPVFRVFPKGLPVPTDFVVEVRAGQGARG
ncbi:MAG: hypothetical protein K2X87_03385 [Gemmataceae bacterium]|nr:hypothetical protein [Gemmataceae bacterium]